MSETGSILRDGLWERAKEVFEEVCALPESERAARLAQSCGSNAELRAALTALLRQHDRIGGFLDQPTVDAQALVDALSQPAARFAPGQRIGHYTLLEEIGEGGFGTVFLAQQDEPIRREVALKVIKPGMDTRRVLARFDMERLALARMDHPGIARVYDGGQTGSGHPYFVMELVRGQPITRFCDERRMAVRDRLRLFTEVCRAVHHAHQKGVIHRDLKPGNVLVVEQDARPQPKVIDFGVAKAIGESLPGATSLTAERQLVGTPTYMSPEQAAHDGRDVDTRADVYALGVLLYELLTGSTPFDSETAAERGHGAWERLIREEAPRRPSTRVGAASRDARVVSPGANLPGDAGPSDAVRTPAQIAAQRRTDARSLATALRGDLDWIVMKCLEKERDRRYGAASELADEIERHLRGDPVRAGPPSAAYRFRKFAARHRYAALAAGGVALALVAGLGLAISGFLAARNALELAEQRAVQARQAATRAEAVSRFLTEMLASADPRVSGRTDLTMAEVLDRAVDRVERGALADEPETRAAVQLTIGRAYRELARYNEGAQQLDAALRTYLSLRGEQDADVADAFHQRGLLRLLRGDVLDALDDLRRAVSIVRRVHGPHHLALAEALSDLAAVLSELGRNRREAGPERALEEAETHLREALAILDRPEFDEAPQRAEALNNLALLLASQRRFDEAQPLLRAAIDFNRRVLGDRHPNLGTNYDNLAQLLVSTNEFDQAEAAYREALHIRRAVFGSDHPEVAVTLHNYAVLLHFRQEIAACEEALREALDIFRRVHGMANLETLTAVDSLVSVVGARGEFAEAERLLLEAYEAAIKSENVPRQRSAQLAMRLADLYNAWDKGDLALRWTKIASELHTHLHEP